MADLTIIMPTWNKAGTIAEALDSVFRQKTSFSRSLRRSFFSLSLKRPILSDVCEGGVYIVLI